MTGFVDRQRAAHADATRGIGALVLSAPEAFHYATGAWIGPAGLFRRAGGGFVVIPARQDLPIGVVVADFNAAQLRLATPEAVVRSHPIWIRSAPVDTSHGLPWPNASRPASPRLAARRISRGLPLSISPVRCASCRFC